MRRGVLPRDRRVRRTREHRARRIGDDRADGHLAEPLGFARAVHRLLHQRKVELRRGRG
jgi:hypothetical protein